MITSVEFYRNSESVTAKVGSKLAGDGRKVVAIFAEDPVLIVLSDDELVAVQAGSVVRVVHSDDDAAEAA